MLCVWGQDLVVAGLLDLIVQGDVVSMQILGQVAIDEEHVHGRDGIRSAAYTRLVTLVHLVIDLAGQEHGRRRAERNIDLPAVPRQGEVIWVSRSLALMVKSVAWMLGEVTPWLSWEGQKERCKA